MNWGATWVLLCLLLTSLATGCGAASGVTLAPAGGTVTLAGAPVAGASVTFIPESGPVAVGVTDNAGKFKLSTGGQLGAPVGASRVSISLTAPTDDHSDLPPEEQMKELTKMMGQAQGKFGAAEKKSLVPEKYSKAETSGLSFTVSTNASENEFNIALEQ